MLLSCLSMMCLSGSNWRTKARSSSLLFKNVFPFGFVVLEMRIRLPHAHSCQTRAPPRSYCSVPFSLAEHPVWISHSFHSGEGACLHQVMPYLPEVPPYCTKTVFAFVRLLSFRLCRFWPHLEGRGLGVPGWTCDCTALVTSLLLW